VKLLRRRGGRVEQPGQGQRSGLARPPRRVAEKGAASGPENKEGGGVGARAVRESSGDAWEAG